LGAQQADDAAQLGVRRGRIVVVDPASSGMLGHDHLTVNAHHPSTAGRNDVGLIGPLKGTAAREMVTSCDDWIEHFTGNGASWDEDDELSCNPVELRRQNGLGVAYGTRTVLLG
jgi:hypothetical protein